MSSRSLELFIFDIYIAILKIEHTAKAFENAQELLYDYKSWDSIIREFEIIGEASKYLIKQELLEVKLQVVVDFRNFIIHKYFGVDADEVFLTIKDDLPKFKVEIIALIEEIDDALKKELIEAFCTDNSYLDFILNGLKRFT